MSMQLQNTTYMQPALCTVIWHSSQASPAHIQPGSARCYNVQRVYNIGMKAFGAYCPVTVSSSIEVPPNTSKCLPDQAPAMSRTLYLLEHCMSCSCRRQHTLDYRLYFPLRSLSAAYLEGSCTLLITCSCAFYPSSRQTSPT